MFLQWLLLGTTEKSSEFQVRIKPNSSLSYFFILCQATTYHYNISRSSAGSIIHILSYLRMNEKSLCQASSASWTHCVRRTRWRDVPHQEFLLFNDQTSITEVTGSIHRRNSEILLVALSLKLMLSWFTFYSLLYHNNYCIIIIMIMIIACCWPQTCSSDTSIVGSWGKLALSSLGCPTCQSFTAASARWFIPSPINHPAAPPAGGTKTSAYPWPTREGPCQTQHLLVLTLIFYDIEYTSVSQISPVETR